MIDFRFDPFSFVFRPSNITGETRTVQYFPAFRRVGFFLKETPQRVTSRPVSVICAGDTLTEVNRLTAPGADNFRIDYGNVNNFAQAGFVELNAARVGQVAVVNYRGLGVNLNASLRDDATPNLQRSVNAPNATAPALAVTGSLDFSATLSAGMQRIRDLTTLTATDLLSLSALLGLTGRTAPQILTGSGYWAKPANVHKVFFVLVGPGGSGHVDGGGGGGGASVYGVADLDAIGGSMFAYVCGVVGIATTMFGCVAGAGSSATGASGASGGTASVGPNVIGVGTPGGMGGNEYFLAVSNAASAPAMASQDATAWAGYGGSTSIAWRRVAYGLGLIVSVAPSGVNASYSYNGADWFTAVGCGSVLDVAFGNGVFVAVGNNTIYKSADGINWFSQSVPQANDWIAVTYGAGLFVAVADTGTNKVMTSPDGVTWTLRTHVGAALYTGVTYGGGLFVAVGQTSAGTAAMTSPDGITWTLQTTPVALGVASDRWYAVAYGNGYFVAVSNYTLGGNYVMNSPDGVNWTLRSVPELGNEWNDVIFGAGIFVAFSSTGTNRVMYSTDGTSWTAVSAAAAKAWFGGVYVPAGGGGNAAGGFGKGGESATLGEAGRVNGFFQGKGGIPSSPNALAYGGGGAGAGGTGADGLILLVY